jgi:hypothetical protein
MKARFPSLRLAFCGRDLRSLSEDPFDVTVPDCVSDPPFMMVSGPGAAALKWKWVTKEEILAAYPLLAGPDIQQALAYTVWRVGEIVVPLPASPTDKARC